MASFGARDRSLRGAARKLAHALVVNGIAHDVKEYAGAGHSFMNDHSAEKIPLVFAVRVWLDGGIRYDEASAQDARRRIVAFFNKHLRAA